MSFKIQASDYVRQAKRINAYQLLDVYVQQIQSDLELMKRSFPEIPEMLKQPIYHVFYAQKYFGIPELSKLMTQMQNDYGKKKYQELCDNCDAGSDDDYKEVISFHQVSEEEVKQVQIEVDQYLQRMYSNTAQYKAISQQQQTNNNNNNNNNDNNNGKGGSGDLPPSKPLDDMEELRKRLDNL